MSIAINSLNIAGNLTRDPELRTLAGDKVVAHFSIAINRRYKGSDGEPKEETTFVDVEAWNRTAELVGQYLTKGSACFIEGRLKLDSWDDKDGQKRSKLKVVAERVTFLDNNRRGGEGQGASQHDDQGDHGGDQGDQEPVAASNQAPRGGARPNAPAPRQGQGQGQGQTNRQGQGYRQGGQGARRTVGAGAGTHDEPPF